jgi:hypothetical protein
MVQFWVLMKVVNSLTGLKTINFSETILHMDLVMRNYVSTPILRKGTSSFRVHLAGCRLYSFAVFIPIEPSVMYHNP